MNSEATINWDALQSADAGVRPFPHLIAPDILNPAMADAVSRDFPKIESPGSFPCETLQYGPAFARLLEDIRGERMRQIVADKLAVDLARSATMVTVRGKCRPSDGKIHIDSKGKLVTVLLYMNDSWESPEGRLRLLNGPENLNDYFAEAPPSRGAMVAFACAPNAWHGHSGFSGDRRAVQLNWVVGEKYLQRERRRHTVSAALKKLRALFSPSRPSAPSAPSSKTNGASD